jgi:hypothetical protein
MVRILVTVVLASILGIALGSFQTQWSMSRVDDRLHLAEQAASTSRVPDATPVPRGVPVVELPDGNSFHFGQMLHGSEMSHEFAVKNVGEGPLILEKTGSTCKCAVGELENSTLLPGQETKITLTWRAQTVSDRFGQAATFRTNDPNQVELRLTIEGSVIDSFVFEPTSISLGDFSSEEGATREFMVYCYADEDVVIESLEWSNSDTAKYIQMNGQPVSLEPSDRHAKANTAYRGTLQVLPGMPVGPITSKISFVTNLGDEIELPRLDVNGRVVSEISVVGGSYFQVDRNVLDVGNISSNDGFSTSIWLVARGEQQEGLEVTVEQLDAEETLKVTVGEPKKLNQRTMIPVKFDVPMGAPDVYYPGTSKGTFARVLVRTNSSKLPELPIYVRLVVSK